MLLAFDIGGTFIKYALVDEDYQVSDSSKVPTPDTIEDFWEALERVISSFQNQISGIAISCPGEINSRLGFVFRGGLIPYLRNIPLASRLTKMFQVPVIVLNDGDAAGLAEARIGNLQDCYCGATFVLGTGVGLALTSNGSLISTLNLKDYLRWPSLGEKQVSPEQKQYQTEILRHGISSLVQNLGSAVNFVAKASHLLELPEEDGVQVFEVLEAGHHEELQELFTSYCREIAILIYNLQSLVRLEKVTIGGGISSQPLLLGEINRQYKSLMEESGEQRFSLVEIQAARYHNSSNLLGAVCHFNILEIH
ncbi:transcriptional regulator [Streptococcus australis]|uniref:ROK family protein n=1 Tax=Streptococcus australis ATCC 700641 TaxID=888833 RepID=E7SBC3_9STRE|nr:ROK family protein [Streptococcus australis]EFV99382.1 ROK family protein [Streptococcus australis ATCC 700641]EGU64287.1 ROK family protein [Streptococcus australis ATCC 700641]SQH66323.1 transcriptional regulator [Streptococcus australis]